jgi:HK97 family phage prohead protease
MEAQNPSRRGAAVPHPVRETRTVTLNEVRVEAAVDGTEIRVGGHAAVWDKPAWIGPPKYGFSERFAKGAFSKTISDGADVRYLFNHNPDHILARTKSGTLSISENANGLNVDATLAPTTVGRDLAILMERGDVNQMSVGMQVLQDKWEEVSGSDGNVYEQRTITEAKLFDVSAVTYPAYEETDAGLRSADLARESRDARGQHVQRAPLKEGFLSVDEVRELEKPVNEPADSATQHEHEVTTAAGEPPTGTPETTLADTTVVDERTLSLSTLLLRHMDGDHETVPRAKCPVCAKAEPPTGTLPPSGTPTTN